MADHPLTLIVIGLIPALLLVFLFWPEGGLLRRWRCRRRGLKILVEDALKLIVSKHMENPRMGLEDLKQSLGCRDGRYAQVLQFLEHNDLALVDDGSLVLTGAGREYATFVLRAHRLYEHYLAERTGYSEEEWHERAEWAEHHLTAEDVRRIAGELHYPNRDPHGDPIPTPDGVVFSSGWMPLLEAPVGDRLTVEHIEDEPRSAYAALHAQGYYPGMQLKVLGREKDSLVVEVEGRRSEIETALAVQISVLPAAGDEPDPAQGIPLSELDPGKSGVVLNLQPQIRGAERRRLMDFGLLPGTEVLVEMRSPGGDPTAYRIRGSMIALRENQSRYIRVAVPGEEGAHG